MSIVKDIRNIYYSYRLCKNIEDNIEVHMCGADDCDAAGEAGTTAYVDAKKDNKRIKNGKGDKAFEEFVFWLRFGEFAEKKGYIKKFWCQSTKTQVVTITDKGIELTDNLLVPFTPVGLWKEIYLEHKVLGKLLVTVISTLVLSVSGLTLAGVWRLMTTIMG